MKKISSLCAFLIAVLLVGGCSSLGGAMSHLASAGGGAAAITASAEPVDFRSDETLCSWEASTMMDSEYWVAKIVTSASSATKNEAEVVYLEDGKRAWAKYVIPSRRAAKSDLAVGAIVFFLSGSLRERDTMAAEEYRKAKWWLGRISSVDELYKNI